MGDLFSHLGSGFATALSPANVMYAFVGVSIGTIVGVLPGIGAVTAIALLIPLSFGLNPISGLILLAGVYYGTMYGGAITSVLLRTPGEVSHVVTSIDGYEMARRGRAGPALASAAVGSFAAGTLSTVALMLLAPALASVAVIFGAAEYFWLMLFALAMATSLTTGSRLKAVIAVLLGLAIATVGLDPQTSVPRLTFGILELNEGIDFALFAMALFAVPEALGNLARRAGDAPAIQPIQGRVWMSRQDWRRSAGPYTRGSVLGFLIGLLPGIGPTLGAFMSYVTERKLHRGKDKFGKGAIEGVAGPEAANNAGVGGAMVPLLTLGIPGSATTALLLFVFMMYGLQPGPLLFAEQPDLVWAIIASMYVGNLVLLLLNLPLVGLFVRLLRIPTPMLFSGVLTFVVLGAYALSFNLFSLTLVVVFGLLGYLMQRNHFPLAPTVLALVLEPLIEQNLRRALKAAGGDPLELIQRPLSAVIVAGIVGVAAAPPLVHRLRLARRARNPDSRRRDDDMAHSSSATEGNETTDAPIDR